MKLGKILSANIDETDLKKLVGDNLKKLREKAGLTQEQLGEKIGLTVTAIAANEQGKTFPKIATLNFLADFYGVSTDEILGRKSSDVDAAINCLKSLGRVEKTENGMYCLTLENQKTFFFTEENLVDVVEGAKEKALESDKTFRQIFENQFAKVKNSERNDKMNWDISIAYNSAKGASIIAEYGGNEDEVLEMFFGDKNEAETALSFAQKVIPLILDGYNSEVYGGESPAGAVVIAKIDGRAYRAIFCDKWTAREFVDFINNTVEEIVNHAETSV